MRDDEEKYVDVAINLTLKDQINFTIEHFLAQKFMKIAFVMFSLMFLGSLFHIIVSVVIGDYARIERSNLLLVSIFPAIAGFSYFASKKAYESSKVMSQTIFYKFFEDRIKITSDKMNSETAYDLIFKVLETKMSLIIYLSNSQALVLPRKTVSKELYLKITKMIFDGVPEEKVVKNKNDANMFIKKVFIYGGAVILFYAILPVFINR